MKRAAVVAFVVASLFLFGCAAIIEMNPNPLGPLTGRWEGTFTLPSHPGPIVTVNIVADLIQIGGDITGTAQATKFGDPALASEQVIAVLGSCAGESMELLFGYASRVVWRFTGVLSGDFLAGVGVYVWDGVDTYVGTFTLTKQ